MSVLDRQISRRQLLQAERCRPSRHAARPSGTGVRMLHSRADHRRHHPVHCTGRWTRRVSVGDPIWRGFEDLPR